jgi:hypothetical protein
VGKTRLARAALSTAEAEGWAVRWVVATRAAASVPLGAVAHLLPAADEAGGNRFELFQRAAAHLAEGAGGARLALGVDDAHLLDDASAALLHQLAATAAAFVVVTVRSGMQAPDAVVALWKDGLAERVEVGPLERGYADELAGVALEGQVDGTTLRDVWQLTRGNPMFLRELIAGGLDSGALARGAGMWRWAGPVTAPPRLVELVETRLGRLDTGERDLLELLAFGEPLGAGLLERLEGTPVLAAAERKGLLSVEQLGRRVEVRVVHPLYGEAVRAQTGPLRLRLVHRRLADAVAAAGARRAGDLLLRGAHHLVQGRWLGHRNLQHPDHAQRGHRHRRLPVLQQRRQPPQGRQQGNRVELADHDRHLPGTQRADHGQPHCGATRTGELQLPLWTDAVPAIGDILRNFRLGRDRQFARGDAGPDLDRPDPRAGLTRYN